MAGTTVSSVEAHGRVLALAEANTTPLVVSGGGDVLSRWDARTGLRWRARIEGLGKAVALATVRLDDGRWVACMVNAQGVLHRLDVATGAPIGEPKELGWVARESPPQCRALVACGGTGDDAFVATCIDNRLVYRRHVLTGEPMGDPFNVGSWITAMAAGRLVDGMWCVLLAGARIGEPLTGEVAVVDGLAAFHLEGGRQLLVCVDHGCGMHRWDAVTGEPIGSRISIPSYAYLFSAYLDHGVPTVFIATDDEDMGGFHIERWRLDTGVRVDVMPPSFRCAFDDSSRRVMALSHEDGSLVLAELPPLPGI